MFGPALRRWWAARPPAWAGVGGPGSARGWEGWEAFDDAGLGGQSRAALAAAGGEAGGGGRPSPRSLSLRLEGELRSGGRVGVAFCGLRFGEGTAAPPAPPLDLSGFWGLAVRCRLAGAHSLGPPPLVVSLRTACLTPAISQGPQDLWQSFLACPRDGRWGVVLLPFQEFQRTWGGRLVEGESGMGIGMGKHKVSGLSLAMVMDRRGAALSGAAGEGGSGQAGTPPGDPVLAEQPRSKAPVGDTFALEVEWVRAVRKGVDSEEVDKHGESLEAKD